MSFIRRESCETLPARVRGPAHLHGIDHTNLTQVPCGRVVLEQCTTSKTPSRTCATSLLSQWCAMVHRLRKLVASPRQNATSQQAQRATLGTPISSARDASPASHSPHLGCLQHPPHTPEYDGYVRPMRRQLCKTHVGSPSWWWTEGSGGWRVGKGERREEWCSPL